MRVIILLLAVCLFSCEKDQIYFDASGNGSGSALVGKWKRVRLYVNPGNGGSWQSDQANPPITLEFTANGTINSNHTLFSQYSKYQVTSSNTLEISVPVTPTAASRTIKFEFNDKELTLTYACIEGCGDVFVRQ